MTFVIDGAVFNGYKIQLCMYVKMKNSNYVLALKRPLIYYDKIVQ